MDCVADDVRQKRVPFDLQDHGRVSGGDGHAVGIEKVRAAKAGADVVVQRHPDIPRPKDKGLPGVVHDGFGPEPPGSHFGIELLNQGICRSHHPIPIAVCNGLRLRCRKHGGLLAAQCVALALFFQMKERGIAVVIADAEFLPHVDSIELFPQSRIRGIVEIETPNAVCSADGVGIRLRHGLKPPAYGDQVGPVDLDFPFVPKRHGWFHLLMKILGVAFVILSEQPEDTLKSCKKRCDGKAGVHKTVLAQ